MLDNSKTRNYISIIYLIVLNIIKCLQFAIKLIICSTKVYSITAFRQELMMLVLSKRDSIS